MATTRLQLLLALLPAASVATLGPMCCGDNFCCALSPSKSISCWGGGGNPFTPPSGSFAALSCAGKAGIAVDDTGAIAACFGSAGYGSEGCATGTVVADAATSFWGGCKIAKATGALSCWGATTVYGTNSRSTLNECTSMYGASSCNAVSVLLAPPSTIPGGYRTVACGGKRAGHFCCAVAARDGTTTCFGKGSSAYAPSAMPLATPHMLSCGTDFCCTLTGTGCVQCFGNLNQGRGGGTDIPSALAGPFVQISCGTYALYVLDKGGTVAAYGKVFSRVMGPVLAGTSTIAVPSNTKFSALPTNGGFGHACALSDSRAAVCWGADYARQVTNAPSSLIAASSAYTFPPSLGTPANPAIGTGPVVATTVMATTTVSTQALGTLGGDITPPYLRVKDGLDEKEALGFCIDLKGWNPVRYDDLQAHSCKKAGRASGSGSDVIGADQRFKLTDKSEIEVLFESNDGTRRCLAARDGSSGSGVDAKVCDGSTVQRFCLVKGEIRAQDGSGRCLVVGSASRQANTYMARTLLLADCQATQAELRMWVYIAQDKRKPQEDAPCGTDGGTPTSASTPPITTSLLTATTTLSTQALGTLGGDITPPYLRVKDGLDEKEALGFCIDLKGWNPVRYDDLQAHSCKKAGRASGSGSDVIGADQRFKLTDKSEIEVLFESNDGTRRCLAARDGSSGSGVDAKVCDGSTVQRFCLVKGEIRAQDGSGRCLVVGSASRQANTYMARTLLLADCQATQAELRMWVYIAQDKRKPQEDAPCGTDGGTPTSASTPPITTSLLTATTTITAAPIVTTTTSFSPSKESISTSSVSTSTPTLTTTTITTSETAKTTTTTTTTVVVTTTTTTTTTTSLASTEEGIVTTVSPVDYSGMSAEEAVKAAKRHQSLAATASTRAKAVLSECRRDCAAKAEASHTHTHTRARTHTHLCIAISIAG